MASEFTINQIIQFANISQYLAGNDKSRLDQLKSGSFVGELPGLLYMENYLLQNINNLNPSSVTLRGTAEYVLSLCGKYGVQAKNIVNNLAQSPPIITGPVNQSGNVGFTAVFGVSVVSSLPITYQWFDYLGNPILGATGSSYSFVNSQLVDSGKTFFVKATNAAGTSVSGTAILTVTVALTAYLYYNVSDPGPTLQANLDPFVYQSNNTITHNAPIAMTLPGGSTPNMYLVVKVPSGESSKSTWFNTALNNGSIPDSVFQTAITFGGFTYYYTRVAVSMDTSATLILS